MQVAEDKIEYNSIDDILSDFDDIFKKSEADLESQLRDVSMYQTYKNTKILNEKKSFSEALSKDLCFLFKKKVKLP